MSHPHPVVLPNLLGSQCFLLLQQRHRNVSLVSQGGATGPFLHEDQDRQAAVFEPENLMETFVSWSLAWLQCMHKCLSLALLWNRLEAIQTGSCLLECRLAAT